MKDTIMKLHLLLGILLIPVCTYGWDVKVINNSENYWRVLGCFDPLCTFHSDVILVGPKSTINMPLPAGVGSCLHHIYYKDDGKTKK